MRFLRIISLTSLPVLLAASLPSCESPSIQWVDCAQNVPIYFTLAGITVPTTNLPSTLKCGELVVPMNYDEPISDENNITLSIAMYRPPEPKGVLFYNGGGGDPNTCVAWEVALGAIDTFDGLLDYDLMMMDTRGTFDSNALNASEVGLAAAQEILAGFPTTQSAFDATKAASAAFIKDVEQWSTPPGIVHYVSTKEVSKDYEQIRIALGYEKVNFLGLSYGTFRANQYAASYPERVGNFVLDAVVPHNNLPDDAALTQIAALNRVLYRADAFCLNNSSCPFHEQGKGAVVAAYQKVLASAPFNVSTSAGTTTVTALQIQQAVANDLESEGVDFPTLFENLNEGLSGNATSFSLSAAIAPNLNIISAGSIVLECGDNNFQYTTFADWEKSLNDGLAHDPNQIAQPINWLLQLGCLAWPYATPPYAPLITHTPLLLVTSSFDGSAPTEWADSMRAQSPNSVLVVRQGDDHTTFSLSDQSAVAIMKKFLRTGEFPRPRDVDDAIVSVYLPGMKRAPIPDPYSVVTGEPAGDVNAGNLTESQILP